ncbi:hypothetical protein F3Y22_tig00110621pilonHSYRG00544 [Hibiscus syriacus]|uniref:Uncharacterized protein n=1 Tax=Hibiscus syriacus TaxID=106335 RepID=A0A6A3A195_HIBSY|nr:hypothetical protein F3Y22_tig00110621pilonHSYRG00544 [Hibiscus syriacus]
MLPSSPSPCAVLTSKLTNSHSHLSTTHLLEPPTLPTVPPSHSLFKRHLQETPTVKPRQCWQTVHAEAGKHCCWKLSSVPSCWAAIDLPPWFSSMSIALKSSVNLFPHSSCSSLCRCFKNASRILTALKKFVKCAADYVLQIWQPPITISMEGILQANIKYNELTNEQIVRSPAYSFCSHISVEGCTTSLMQGQNNFETSCLGDGEMKIYAIERPQLAESLTLSIQNPRPLNSTENSSRVDLMCFARFGAMASATLHDYSVGGLPVMFQMFAIPWNCKSLNVLRERLDQTVHPKDTCFRKYSAPYESYYLPDGENQMSDATDFQLEPLLSNYSVGGLDTWTYFLLNVPPGAAGGNLHARLMHLNGTVAFRWLDTMSISLEDAQKDAPIMVIAILLLMWTSYSFCTCDRNHGGHVWRSIALITSNIAALLPSFWSLHQRAFAEWVIYTSSGIASALYHACDSGTWCAFSFGVCSNFGNVSVMDFWLSFMAVVTTFVYLTTIDETLKRAIHSAAAIITSLMAVTKATSTFSIILVLAIGAIGLLLGWLIEFSTKYRPLSYSMSLCLNRLERWPRREWPLNIVNTVKKQSFGFHVRWFYWISHGGTKLEPRKH